MLASADAFSVVVSGKGGHASMPQDAIDPVPAACEIVLALQAMVTRRVPAFDPAVVTIGRIAAGTASNVIPETALLEGTLRAVSESSRALALEGVQRVAEQVAAAHLCSATVSWSAAPYPVTVNSEPAAEQVLSVANCLVGELLTHRMETPVMGAEDWSYVLQQVSGAMAFLGTAPPGVESPAANHSNRMLLDESAMRHGIALHAAMALAAPSAA